MNGLRNLVPGAVSELFLGRDLQEPRLKSTPAGRLGFPGLDDLLTVNRRVPAYFVFVVEDQLIREIGDAPLRVVRQRNGEIR